METSNGVYGIELSVAGGPGGIAVAQGKIGLSAFASGFDWSKEPVSEAPLIPAKEVKQKVIMLPAPVKEVRPVVAADPVGGESIKPAKDDLALDLPPAPEKLAPGEVKAKPAKVLELEIPAKDAEPEKPTDLVKPGKRGGRKRGHNFEAKQDQEILHRAEFDKEPKLRGTNAKVMTTLTGGIDMNVSGGRRTMSQEDRACLCHEFVDFMVWAKPYLRPDYMLREGVVAAMLATWNRHRGTESLNQFWGLVQNKKHGSFHSATRQLARWLEEEAVSERREDRKDTASKRLPSKHEVYVHCLLAWDCYWTNNFWNVAYDPDAPLPGVIIPRRTEDRDAARAAGPKGVSDSVMKSFAAPSKEAAT